MDLMGQYEQDSQLSALGPMDTSPITQSLPQELIPNFIPTVAPPHPDLALQNSLLPAPDHPFLPGASKPKLVANGVGPMHITMPPLPAYLNNAMEAIDPPPLTTPNGGFITDMRAVDPSLLVAASEDLGLPSDARTLSLSPPRSLLPSPSVHGPSSFNFNALPPMESTLERRVVAGGRANTSLSPPPRTSPFPSLSPPSLPGSSLEFPPSAPNVQLEESLSHQHPQTMIGKMLKNIAITAIDAGDAFESCHGTTKVGELRDRIVEVLDVLSRVSFTEQDSLVPTTTVSPLPAPLPEPPVPPIVPVINASNLEANHPLASDLSRKRCASDLEEHRSVKALKREPQDDNPLTLTVADAPVLPAGSVYSVPHAPLSFPIIPAPIATSSQSSPPSRPTTPTLFPAHNVFNGIKQQNPIAVNFPPFVPTVGAGPGTLSALPLAMPVQIPPAFPHSSWSDPILPTTTRHHHSLSAGSAGSAGGPMVGLNPTGNSLATSAEPFPLSAPSIQPMLQQPLSSSSAPAPVIPPGLTRSARSGSINGTMLGKSFYSASPYVDLYSDWRDGKASTSTRTGQSTWYMGSEPPRTFKQSLPNLDGPNKCSNLTHNSPPSDGEDDDDDSDTDESTSGKAATADRPTSTPADFPPEYRKDVDRIFFEFLNKLCSNLEATDAKGEPIHQTLMAKKMQRLDESPDFRPFKFRIQAFTSSFLEELARQGYPEEKIPMKKVRNYLWRQQYILRFNEDGKKAKSKGNHIWNIEAKKAGDGRWEFRPFHRKLAGPPPAVAYCGLRWSWKPHVWDPQWSFKKIKVSYSSPSLPSWLSWKNGELCGTPPQNAESCQVTAVAKFVLDEQDTVVRHPFTISIAPVSALDAANYPRSRRSSLITDPPKRSTSDSALFQAPQRNSRATRGDDLHVVQVLQNVVQRVTTEAESQFISPTPQQGELQDLVKQKHVLEQTVDAYDKAISGQGHSDTRRLAVAAQHVVLQAAQTVIADRTVATGGRPAPQAEKVAVQSVSVSELTDTTQDAIAMAVKMNGTASNEVDIIVTATSILKARTPLTDSPPSAQPRIMPAVAPSRMSSAFPPSNLSTLPEYA